MNYNKKLFSSGIIDLKINAGRYCLYQESPLYLNVIKKDVVEAYPSDQGGGLRGGDSHIINITLENKSKLLWSVPAGTLCYPSMCSGNEACRIVTRMNILDESFLCFINKPLIPVKDSVVEQETVINIKESSCFFYLDVFACGRMAYDEIWLFSKFKNKFELNIGPRLIYKENWQLWKNEIPLGNAGFGGMNMQATIISCNTGRDFSDYACGYLKNESAVYSSGKLYDDIYMLKVLDKTGILINGLIKEASYFFHKTGL